MIDPITGAGLAEALTAINAAMQGQTLSDAYNQRITGQYPTDNGPTIGFTDYTSDKPSISGDTNGSISSASGATPVDAWNDYVENTPTVTVSETTGGVVSGSKVGTFIYSIMEEHPGTATSAVKAIVPVAVPLAAAITAIGQALGVSIDSENLDNGTKQSLINSYLSTGGVIYDKAKGLVTAWRDEWGRILFPKKAFDAVSETLSELDIGDNKRVENPDYPSYNVIPIPSAVSFNRSTWISVNCYGVSLKSGPEAIGWYLFEAGTGFVIWKYWIGDEQFTEINTGPSGAAQITISNGKVINPYTVPYNEGRWSTDTSTSMPLELVNVAEYLFGDGAVPMGNYPEGTSHSEANSYTSSTIPIAGNLATSYDPDTGILGTEPLVPIHLTDDPYDATGDVTNPTDPTDEDNPGLVTPPIPIPIPDTEPSNPDVPLVNPSIVNPALINELVDELANTLDPQPAQSSGLISVPPLPGIGDPATFPSIIPQSGPGFIHVYNPTPAEFIAFGSWLWVTYADATIDKILNNPFDGVIGAHELYATPNRDGRDNIRSAFLTCPTTADLVPNRYSEIDCGTVIVPEFYGNYLDYSPYSQAYIYLPFIGIIEVSIDDIVGHAVNIRYRIDSYSGSCIAMIFVAKDGYQNLCYQFAGNCSVEVPMAGGSQAAIKAAEMQAEAYAGAAQFAAVGHLFGGIGSALMGNIGGLIAGIGGVASDYGNARAGMEAARVANKSSVQHSGQFGASHGAMGQKIPFIIIRNPIQVKVVNYNDDYGYPAHKRVIIGGCTGYLRVREVNVVSAHATDEEKMAIEAALKGGVYVS